MTSKIKTAAIATVLVLATATGALAQAQQGGVRVGVIDQTTVADQSTNVALGRYAKARQAIGAVQNVRAGYVRQVTVSRRATNLAVGDRAAACQTIGTIGRAC